MTKFEFNLTNRKARRPQATGIIRDTYAVFSRTLVNGDISMKIEAIGNPYYNPLNAYRWSGRFVIANLIRSNDADNLDGI